MNGLGLAILIIIGIIAVYFLWKILKPYFIKHDTTMLFTGGLGSGKTLESVKVAIVQIRKQRLFKWKLYNLFHVKIHNKIAEKVNKHRMKVNNKKYKKDKSAKLKPLWTIKQPRRKPMLYCNIPIHFKTHLFRRKKEWSVMLAEPHLLLLKEIVEYSVVLVDELPQFINQFNWNSELIQKNVNEFITYFRHYVGGYFITNAQSTSDIVVQVRRKLNIATWCFNFKKHLFGLFYTVQMCDIMLNDDITTIANPQNDENTKTRFGLFPGKSTYDSRCYSERYKNVYIKAEKAQPKFKKLKTNKVIRLVDYKSPLDDIRSQEEKKEQWSKGEKLWRQ